ncbi:MAG: NAD(P)-dependent glycerol-3-phosphate dehydrogenase, partial [Candidatus Magasanikbacteria bacterium]|nr:NAD(P)-dependent glycerol-3-phosphate dehydrogenase [Candidatus Magasanikbacteria bacterium]
NYFTAMNIAGENSAIQLTKQVLENENLRLIKNTDIIGTEVAGSLKNVYAIAIGLCDCYGYPMNTKAVIFVSALKEISTLVKKMGGDEKTVFDLAGMGDLIGTAMSEHSRNRKFGACLPNYLNKEQTTKAVGQTVEGVETCKTVLALAKKYKVKMPLTQAVYEIVWGGGKPDLILKKFLNNLS